jgi:hypothetical protein
MKTCILLLIPIFVLSLSDGCQQPKSDPGPWSKEDLTAPAPVPAEKAAEEDAKAPEPPKPVEVAANEPAPAKPVEKKPEPKKPKPPAPAKPTVKKEEKKPAKPQAILHGFENAKEWKIMRWGDGARASSVTKPVTEGKVGLRVTANRPKTGKIILAASTQLEQLWAYDSISADVFVEAGKNYPAVMTVAVLGRSDDQKFTWLESPPRMLKEGWNKNVSWDLYAPEWKSEATGWHFCVKPVGKVSTCTLHILIHGLDHGEALVLDNMRIALAPVDKPIRKDAKAEKWAGPMSTKTGKGKTPDLTRAATIREYALGTLAQFAADLRSLGQGAAAADIEKVIGAGLKAELIPRKLPAEKPAKKPPKKDAAKKPEAKKAK